MNKIFSVPSGALWAWFPLLALMAGFGGCPAAGDSGDTAAPGPVSNVYGYYNKMAGGLTLTWTDPADQDLAEIRVSWNGGNAAAAKGAGTCTVAVAEDRIAPSWEITLKAADAAGNEAEPVRIQIRPDSTRSMIPVPGGTVTVPPSGSSQGAVFFDNLPKTVAPFYILATEVTYDLWYEVKVWAASAERGAGRYTFANEGREGHDGLDGAAPTGSRYEPATNFSMRDAIVWCNAWSEKTGKTPAYYEDEACTVVLRENKDEAVGGNADTLHIRPGANGYRLPSGEEWIFAARGGVPSGDPDEPVPWNYFWAGSNTAGEVGWFLANAGGSTHEAAEKQPNTLGLYDMSGNVGEMTLYQVFNVYGTFYQALGGDFGKDQRYYIVGLDTTRGLIAPFTRDKGTGFRPVASGGL